MHQLNQVILNRTKLIQAHRHLATFPLLVGIERMDGHELGRVGLDRDHLEAPDGGVDAAQLQTGLQHLGAHLGRDESDDLLDSSTRRQGGHPASTPGYVTTCARNCPNSLQMSTLDAQLLIRAPLSIGRSSLFFF